MTAARLAPLARPLLLLAGLLVAGLALRQLPGASPQALLGRWVTGHGPLGALAFVAAGGALCAVGLPRQAVAFAGGLALGPWAGGALSLLAMLAGCALDFAWARGLARDWARRRLRGRWARLDAFLAANPFAATLTLRLLPVGSNVLLNLLAGTSGVAFAPFLAATALGYLPQTAVFALLGAGTRVDRTAQLWLGLALFAASAGLGLALLRRAAGKQARLGSAQTRKGSEDPLIPLL